jgi:hypothetical protein
MDRRTIRRFVSRGASALSSAGIYDRRWIPDRRDFISSDKPYSHRVGTFPLLTSGREFAATIPAAALAL